MKLRFLLLTFALSTLTAHAQRSVAVSVEALFAFDPLSGRFEPKCLPPVATYIEDWRVEIPDMKLVIVDSLKWGYRHYTQRVDTTLIPRILCYLGATIDSTSVKGRNLRDFPHSRAFNEYFNSDIERIKRYFASPLCRFDTTLKYNAYGDSDFEALFHTFQREVTGAQLSIFSPPRLTAQLPEECYISNIVSLLYYDNSLVVVEMTGDEILEMIERSYSLRYYRPRSVQDDLLKHRVPSYLHTSISGVPHTLNLSKRSGKSVENWTLKPTAVYRVAMNSFLARDRVVVRDYGDYKELIVEWLRSTPDPLKYRVSVEIQPRRVVDEIMKREIITIFGETRELF